MQIILSVFIFIQLSPTQSYAQLRLSAPVYRGVTLFIYLFWQCDTVKNSVPSVVKGLLHEVSLFNTELLRVRAELHCLIA